MDGAPWSQALGDSDFSLEPFSELGQAVGQPSPRGGCGWS